MSTITTISGLASGQAVLRSSIDRLTRQVTTGQRGVLQGDLGPEARRAIDLRGEIARRDAYVGAADRALARSGAAQDVMTRLNDIAGSLSAQAKRAKTLGETEVVALARSARSALEEAAALLNTRHAGEYLFGGSDVAAPPVPDAAGIADGPMATAIAASVATLDATNAATILAAAAAAAVDPASTPFSVFLEGNGLEGNGMTEARRAVQVADGDRIAIGVLPLRGQPEGSGTPWGRDLLRDLAVLAALTPAQAVEAEGWMALMDGVTGGLDGAAEGLAAEQGMLGSAEQRVGAARERHEDTKVALRKQLGLAEEVDLAEASAQLRAVQSRLEASYEVTGMVSRLSLAALLR